MDPYSQAYDEGMIPDEFQNAAVYVGVMIASAAIFLTVLKRSGFRAMVAVGRG